ncbi:MAG: hypothetical protein M3R65_11205, partial [Gemmatimonadota bacterium]|nr:hypothetical protein [Gemmatimonadota bacterium]
MRVRSVAAAALSMLLFLTSASAFAQTAQPATAQISVAPPGRDPGQPIDTEYTRKIHEYTTETFFLSPLVDYLPASATIPSPKAVLGDIA